MPTAAQLSENSHQGFDGIKAAFCLGSMQAKPNTASGMPVCLWREGTGSRSSGKERDAETGLDYFGARYYSGAQGRFTSPDPLLNSGRPDIPQSWNRYAYTLNNPLKFIDPDGLWEWEADRCAKGDRACQQKRDEDRQWFRNAVSEIDLALLWADANSVEYQELKLIRSIIGSENDGGVIVAFDSSMLEKLKVSGGSKRGRVIFGDPKELFNEIASRNRQRTDWFDPLVESAGIVVHEFAHQLDTPKIESVYQNEVRAYRYQSNINVIFNKPSLWELWNPVWGKIDSIIYRERRGTANRDRERAIHERAGESTERYHQNMAR